jgi:hypothetical protein
MAAVNRRWARWIYGSVANYLKTKAFNAGIPLIVEFLDTTQNASWENARTRAQATISGPITIEGSPGLFRVIVTVFVAVSSNRSLNDYDHIDAIGAMSEALDQCIQVVDAGDTNAVDVGTLTPFQAPIEPVHLKPADQDDTIFSTVSTTYEALFRV